MQYTRLGNTGLIISRLAFGAMTFGSLPDHPMAHVFEDNLGAADVELAPSEVTELDKLTEPALLYPNWFHTRTADQVSAEALGLVPRPEEKKPAAD